ncbi:MULTISPECIES: response regulator transcription factor [unclassified Lentimicrobium]|uniref:response regulator transcription factor n=1 Tax=unclassified Lentimicrobium TaxID=2677434 RepID=UPI0015567DD1|nr:MULTISPECIES: response regulator [unclassified Lentimicrobium]NPD46189.1 response regulator [Lentimicrobium sp. S6]NPD83240.1 response regulator [Lentimicrobium sp. L6]
MKNRIIAIDDEQSIRFIIENTFKKDFDISTFKNGEEALVSMQTGEIPDLIICDIEMPVMNGFEFIKQVRASGFFDDIPLLMLSGKENSADRINCFDSGADDYIIKPFNPKELLARVKRRMKTIDVHTSRKGH